jgi:hypothetical protein
MALRGDQLHKSSSRSKTMSSAVAALTQDGMYLVGGIEIVAGLVVLIAPRFGGLRVADWLTGIVN